jgi:dienelactone hydrolase
MAGCLSRHHFTAGIDACALHDCLKVHSAMITLRQLLWATSFALIWPIFAIAASSETPRDGQNGLGALLAHTVLDEGQSLAEVQKFCDRRIAAMPQNLTWSAWQREADRLQRTVLENVVFRNVPPSWRDDSRRIEWLDTIPGGPGYRIKKLRYEALPGLWIPALLYEPEKLEGRVPVVLNVNGHDSKGKAAPYKQIRCINLAKRGMLALNVEWLGMGQLQGDGFAHGRMNQLDLCGTSGLAVFYLVMERGLDLLVDHPHADVERVAMAGLSAGGWQTSFFSSLDRRVTLANPVAGYASFKTRVQFFSDLGDSEQTPTDLAMTADYKHLTAMRAPRPTLLTYNAKDECCFASAHALPPLLDAAKPIFELVGAGERLRSHVNDDPGTHNFERENREQFYKMLGDHFYAGDSSYDSKEIDSESEVKKAEEINMPLPEDNLDFHKLAVQLMSELPAHKRQQSANTKSSAAASKPTAESVASVARLASYEPAAQMVGEKTTGETKARFWRIKLGDDWTVPVVELTRGTPQETCCVIADGGRIAAAEQVESLLAERHRVLAIDPFYLGESKIEQRGYLFALLVSSVGARPVGVQADQLQAVTRWANSQFGEPVKQHIAIGPRVALAALLAAATASDKERPQQLVLHGSLGSLREVIENNWSVEEYPEMFCFGLLQHCDVDDLVELAKPCDIVRK